LPGCRLACRGGRIAKLKKGKGTYGQNGATGGYGDLVDMGILDPIKVTRLALQNAASVAGLLLTTEVMMAEAPNGPGRGLPGLSRRGQAGRFRAPHQANAAKGISGRREPCRTARWRIAA